MTAGAPVIGYTLRACLPAKRRFGLLLLCLAGIVFALLTHAAPEEEPAQALAQIASVGLFSLVLPLASLVVGDAVLGAELRLGTLAFTWLSPVPFATIAVGRFVGGTLFLWMTVVPTFAVCGVVAGVPDAAVPLAAAAAAGSAAYVALFVAIGTIFRRATVASLTVVFLIERLLGSVLSGIAQWSPAWQSLSVYVGLSGVRYTGMRQGIPVGWGAVTRLVIITAVMLALASWRLGRLRLAGPTD